MSADMDFQATIRKMREVVNVDFSDWTGARVGRHLYLAGECRMRGEHYMFPGYIKFPIRKYDNKNPAHLPFDLDMTAWPKLIVMEHGAAEWNEMRNHWKAFVPTLLQAGRNQLVRTGIIPLRANRQGNNGQQPGPQRQSASSPNVRASGNRTVNPASSQHQSNNVDDPRPGTSTQQEPNVSHQIQPLPDDDEMPHINILEYIQDQEMQLNVGVTTEQPSNASATGVPLPNASKHDSNFPLVVQPVPDNASASTAIEPNGAAV
ncbi:uncharacterized protein LOC116337206 [Contarinia nasturtii]|uniref:uncharacterized protein LOC116337206 n=1 Tax=Contarinia nasturtii TaxID=265458 RepID=UPI0012D3AAA9|nr:uncharacterized protein LOC116337206 [Contarinia nasturtii]